MFVNLFVKYYNMYDDANLQLKHMLEVLNVEELAKLNLDIFTLICAIMARNRLHIR